MSPTSYQAAPPRDSLSYKRNAKVVPPSSKVKELILPTQATLSVGSLLSKLDAHSVTDQSRQHSLSDMHPLVQID